MTRWRLSKTPCVVTRAALRHKRSCAPLQPRFPFGLCNIASNLSSLEIVSSWTAKGAGRDTACPTLLLSHHPTLSRGRKPKSRAIPLSEAGISIRDYVRQALEARRPVGYDRKFLDQYRPNVSFYLTGQDRARLAAVGRPQIAEQPAGTYAKQILNRLLIDLAWNSSRLEGNTYSLLDTKRLIELGEEAEGRAHLEAQMILNHKDAIEFLVSAADEIGFNRYTILNLHALLANNLLA